MLIEPGPLMTNKHAGKETRPLVIDRQVSDHAISADRVLDVLYPHTSSSVHRCVTVFCVLARTPPNRSATVAYEA
jgi:hypothetical protein